MKIRCTNIKYDFDGQDPKEAKKLPKKMTIELDESFATVLDDPYDLEETVEEIIEDKTGCPVASFSIA